MNWEQPSTTEDTNKHPAAQAGSVLFMLLTIVVLLVYAAIFMNPHIFFNPFKPVVAQIPPTPTANAGDAPQATPVPTSTRPEAFPPTWTPTPTPTITNTPTPWPTWTPSPTPRPTSTPKPLPAFTLRQEPIYTSQIAYNSLYAGQPQSQWPQNWWSGVAGEVTDRNGEGVMDVTIRIWDDFGHVWETRPGQVETNTGVRYWQYYDSAYGGQGTRAWWDQFLGVSCQESIAVHVKVIQGNKQSPTVDVRTTGECTTNLILIHFQKNF
jgi:hypothetical protein